MRCAARGRCPRRTPPLPLPNSGSIRRNPILFLDAQAGGGAMSRVMRGCAVVAVLLGAQSLTAQRPARKNLTYEQTFSAPAGGRRGAPAASEGGILGALPQITGWADADHYLE